MEDHVNFLSIPELKSLSDKKKKLALMNMIRSEQEITWRELGEMRTCVEECITSGVLLEERELYLGLTSSWGWTLVEEAQKDDWLAFRFSCCHT